MSVRPTLLAALAIAATLLSVTSTMAGAAADYPAVDAGYHSYAEMRAEIKAIAAAHPKFVRVFSIGRSAQGRRLWAAEITDHAGRDEGEPEVLFDGLHHAREHLTAEMTLSILRTLVDNYRGTNALGRRVTPIVKHRRIWIVFMVNPDGLVKDLSGGAYGGGHYAGWRKNRQHTPGSKAIGTDLNRNYGYHWGCCGGSSGNPAADTFRGPHAWSAPETRAMRDFVLNRVIDGRQRIRTHITFHSAGEEVLWPYGYTYQDVPHDMTWLDMTAMRRIGKTMAASNGYSPKQSSNLYPTDGDQIDWMYGRQRIFSYTFEMYPSKARDTSYRRFYPPDELIARETRRNRDAVLTLMEVADCPYRALGAAQATAFCGPFFDDLEIDRGWTVNPDADDTASSGIWSRGIPTASRFQLGSATSGEAVLVTGRVADTDVDAGATTVRSPAFSVPADTVATLHLRYWAGLSRLTTGADGLEIRLVDPATGEHLTTALEVRGDGTKQLPVWRELAFDIPLEFAGRELAIELDAFDTSERGTVEAAIDNPRVTLP